LFSSVIPSGCNVRCPGCAHRGWEAKKSEEQKQTELRRKLKAWENRIEPIRSVSEEKRWGYRHKSCLHAHWNGYNWQFGLRVRQSWYECPEVVAIPDCPIHSPWIRNLIQNLSGALPESSLFPLVFLNIAGTQVTLVVKSKNLPDLPRLDWRSLGVSGLWVNLNPSAGNRVFSHRGWHLIWGEPDSLGEDGEIYGPESFQQLIPELQRDALEEAKAFFFHSSRNPTTGRDAILDFYSGSGRSLKLWKESGVSTLGVELNGDAIRCGFKNVGKEFFLRGRVSDRIPQVREWLDQVRPQSLWIFANPPRLGLEPEVIRWILEDARPGRIAYLSCSAGTLSRDLSRLTHSGFEVHRIIPYDFFPQTHHVEILALLGSHHCFPPAFDSGIAVRPE